MGERTPREGIRVSKYMVSNIYNSGVSGLPKVKGFQDIYVYNSPTTDAPLVYPQGIEGPRVNIPETYRVSRA